MLSSTLAVPVIGAVAGSAVGEILRDCQGIWREFRKARRHLTYRTGRWWTRNWGYIPRYARAPEFRHSPWWNTGPYWLNSPPPGYAAGGRGPRDVLGRPVHPDRAGIVPYGS
jgi:hypothetical protein